MQLALSGGDKTPQRGSFKTLNTVFSFTPILYNLSHVTDPLPPTTDHILTLFCLLLSQRTLAPGLTSGKLLPIWGRFVECTARAHSPRQHRQRRESKGGWKRLQAGKPLASGVPRAVAPTPLAPATECCFLSPGRPQGPVCFSNLGR